MEDIRSTLKGAEFGSEAVRLWREYAADATAEAQFVKDIDKLEFIMQAIEYEQARGIDCEDFLQASIPKIRHARLQDLLRELLRGRHQ